MTESRWQLVAAALAASVAFISARRYAGGWNDGSRLATVESLVDYGTWAIDDSIFVDVPRGPGPKPFDETNPSLNCLGTYDLLFIHGRYYSDKSPVPALLMAGEYACIQRLTGLTARSSPDRFCRWMTLLSSGIAYVAAVWCVFRLGRPLGLHLVWRLALTASFAMATVAPTYAQQVNNHILLLAVTAALGVELAWISAGQAPLLRIAFVGWLLGLGYTIDLGVGPVLVLTTGLLLSWRFRHRPLAIAVAVGAAMPMILLHHAINYLVGGTLGPANAVASYLQWSESPFTAQTMTGGWHHPSVTRFVLYSLDMIVGKRGILGHDLPLCLAVLAFVAVWRGCRRERPELFHALVWSAGAWLLYGATSTNSAGVCCSIRWLVPMIAPGYFVLALVLRDRPEWRPDFVLLSLWGAIFSGVLMMQGPWHEINPLTNWLLVGGAFASWCCLVVWRRRHTSTAIRDIISPARAA